MKLTKSLIAFTALALSSTALAENLTLTKVELDTSKSEGNCHTDILEVPKDVQKYYVAMGESDDGYYACHVYLLHDEKVSFSGKFVKYLSFNTAELGGGYSRNSYSAAYPSKIKTVMIKKK